MKMTTEQISQKKAELEANISKVAGFPCELTIRDDREFTVSADGNRDWSGVVRYFGGWLKDKRTAYYDAECDFSCFYFTV